jgi:hypothetical protein
VERATQDAGSRKPSALSSELRTEGIASCHVAPAPRGSIARQGTTGRGRDGEIWGRRFLGLSATAVYGIGDCDDVVMTNDTDGGRRGRGAGERGGRARYR